jgi:hypothetical protein
MHLPIQHLFSQHSAPEIRIVVAFGERIEIDARSGLREFESSEQVNVLPSDGRDMLEDADRRPVASGLLLRVDPRQQRRVVVDGRCFLSMMGAIHQMERELRAERAAAGRTSAKARGKTGGRPRTDAAKLENARILYENSGKTAAEVCAVVGVGRRTFFSYLAEFKKAHVGGSEGVV